ncbi:unnamed protein product, partial [Lymnaea stagnalis]
SFLTLEWVNPNVSESGTYLCKANAFNQADDILNDFNNLTAQSTQTNNTLRRMQNDFNNLTAQSNQTKNKLQKLENDFNNLTAQSTQTENKLQKLENDFKNLTDQSTQNENELQKLENDFKNLTAQSTRTENKLQKLETKLSALESTIFKTSTVVNGRQYHLSLYEPNSAVNAEMACEALGGYLAEVDDKNEYDVLKTLIGMPSAHGISFLLGGTDEGHEGRWVNRHSGTPLGYTSWMQGNPDNNLFNGVRENCQAMVHFDSVYDFVMNDVTCFNSNAGMTKLYFICEVPI